MVTLHRLALSCTAIAFAGAIGGYALGGYATGGGASAASISPDVAMADDGVANSDAAAADPADVAESQPAERYRCRGCGPSLSQRRERAYEAQYAAVERRYAADVAPLPPYRPVPFETASDTVPDEQSPPASY